MLKSLHIKDYALIEKISTEFHPGLNIITGETGAGKSILIDAMGLLLGERASSEVIRKDAQKTIIEGIFNVEGNKKVEVFLGDNDIDYQPELILRREISLKGSNRCFINDTPVSLSILKECGNLLVDLHGQHEHQSLLRNETHIVFLDEFGDYEDELNKFSVLAGKLNSLISQKKELKKKEDVLKEKKDLYSFQIKEIDNISPLENEDEMLVNELNILENAEKLIESSQNIYTNLYESDNAVYNSLVEVKKQLSELLRIDKTLSDLDEECGTALTLIKDISNTIRAYKDKIDLDPERLETIRERLGAINLLKKKYGGSLESVLAYRKKIGEEFEIAENYSDNIKKLEDEITAVSKLCGHAASSISEKRKEISKIIEMQIAETLAYLGIPDAKFEVKIVQKPADNNSESIVIVNGKSYYFNNRGYDEVEFYISTNKGEDTKPLSKVASGGEISRVMLALKSILAKSDRLPLLIFDEIDTGVSGRIAQKVGLTLKSLASFHQIISITHLPQIAGLADHHYLVEKKETNNRVTSTIKPLDDEQRVREVAKLLSGEEITEISLKGARELINSK